MKTFLLKGSLALILLFSFSKGFSQVANDDCATAQNLGTLPTPQSCTSGPIGTRGQGAAQAFNLTNNSATPSSPYISMTGCQAGNATTSSPASDVWYQVTTTGSDLIVNLTGGINQPNVALWQGACGSLVGVGCATGNAGNLSTTFQGLPPGVYYIQISGNNPADQGNFNLTLQNDNNCAACLIQQNLTVNPLPTNGFYQAGTVVSFCFNITQWTTVSANWLNGVEITFGGGWNVGSIVATPPNPNCDGSVGTWGYYPGGVTSSANGSVWGPGFYFDRDNDGNPGNDFGDNCATGSPNIGNWQFCFTMEARSDCGAPGFDPDMSLVFNTTADGESGSWTSIACQNDPNIFFSAQVTCCPEPVTVNTNASCFGVCDGTATATGQGTGPWNYTWIDQGTGLPILVQNNVNGPANINNLCAGTYIVETFDIIESCTARDTFIVTEPTQITSTPAIVDVLCNGASTGSITMNGTAGSVGPYTYSLNGGPFQAGNSFTGLAAGTYSVTVRDATPCTRTFANLVINEPAAITATPAVVDVLCNGGNTGTITINATAGGVGPYTYSLNGGPFQGSNVFPGLTAGTYTVTVRDANLCTITLANIIVNEPAVITGTPAVVDVLCNGGNTGSITINATAGGVGPYTYSLNGGPFQGSNVFPGLTAGTYTVTIRDANLCTIALTNIIVNEPAAITGTPAVVDVLCNGGNTGSITINATAGGVGPYNYSLNGGPFQGSNVFPSLTAGTYTVTIRDANLCTVTLTNIIVNEPAAITGTPAVVDVLCNGGNTGSITINATAGGVGPYMYSLNGGPFQGSNVFPGLTAGTYTVTIRDANLCTITLTNIIVNEPAVITGTPAVVDVLCNGGNTGSITINATAGGVGPYTYSLNGGPFQGSNVFPGLTAGTYTVTIRDANLCTVTLTNIIVNEPAAITATSAVVDVACNGGNTGSITINGAAGGVGPYMYSLNGGPFQGSNVFAGLTAGTYSVTVRDANLCTITLTNIIVNEPAAITGTPAIVDIACNGGSTGSITINATAGGVGPYMYSLNGGPFQGSNVFLGLTAGTYTVTIRDANLCTVTLTNLVINEPAALTGVAAVVDITCNGANDGSITINGSGGGTAPYQYSLNGGPLQAGNSFTGLSAGTYSVTLQDANGCTLPFTNLVINEPSALTANDSTITASCVPGADGEIWINNTAGGVGPYSYSLNGGPFQAGNSFTGLNGGAYVVTVRDANGCTFVINSVVPTPGGVAGNTVLTMVTCNGGNDGQIDVNATGGTAPFQYSINGGPLQAGNSFPGLTAGNYTIQIVDAFGCSITLSPVITEPAIITGTPAVVDVLCNAGNTGSITINATAGGVGPYMYSLNGGPFQGSNVFPGLTAGTYTVTIQDASMCTVTLTNIVVNEPAVLVGVTAIVNVSCNGANDGSITINGAGGGTAPYQYNLNGGPLQAGNSFTGLAPGTYSAGIEDANGCTLAFTNLVITEPLAISATDSTVTASCVPGADGEIWINNTAGGTGPYTYSLNGGPFQAGNSFTGLNGGSYPVTVMDANGCTFTLPAVMVPTPGGVTGNTTLTMVTCNGGNDGQIDVTATGGTAPFQYSINGGPLQAGNSFPALTAGNYTIQIVDAFGCSITLSPIITEPAVLSGTPALVDVSCNGANDGSITINGSAGGIAPYQYSLNGGPLQAGNAFTGLAGGTYTVAIQDANGCTVNFANLVINEAAAIMAIDSTIGASCNPGNDGEVWVINVTGGVGPYEYNINGGAFQSGNGFTGLAGGAHTIVVRDANGCTFNINSNVPSPGNISAVDSLIMVLCPGGADGEIWVNATTSNPPISYTLNGGPAQASNSFTGLIAGNYTAVATDLLGCAVTLNVVITEPAAITGTPAVVDVLCNGGSTGEIAINATAGGTTPYTYSLNGGPAQASNTFTGLTAGTYAVTIIDSNSCSATISNIVVAEPAAISATAAGVDPLCNGGSDGSVTINNVTGGTGPFQFSLNAGPLQASNVFNGLSAGNYIPLVQDANGCTFTLPTVVLGEPAAIAASDSTILESCNPGNDGEAWIINVAGGVGPYQYSIDGGALQASNGFTGLNGGAHLAVVQDANGCTFNLNLVVPSAGNITAVDSLIHPLCPGSSDGEIWINATSQYSPITYSLNGGAPQAGNSFTGLAGGNHTVDVVDALGCSVTLNVTLIQPLPIVASDSAIDLTCFGSMNGEIWVNNTAGGTTPYQYALNGGPLQSGNSFSGLIGGTYTVMIQDSNGCQDSIVGVVVNEPLIISATDSIVDASCNVGGDGEIWILNATGGDGTYTYSLNGGAPQAGNSFLNISAGSHQVVVIDGNGCTDTLNVTVVQPSGIQATSGTTMVSCNGGTDGTVFVTVTAGVPPLQYSLNGGAFGPNDTFPGLPAGPLQVTVTDSFGCLLTLNDTILEPLALSATDSLVMVTCNGADNGEIWVLNAAGGTPAYTYSLDGGPAQTANSFVGLAPSTYAVNLIDSNGCSILVDSATITEPAALSASSDSTSTLCFGSSDGSITISNVTGGTPGYAFSIDSTNFQLDSTFTGLVAGTYNLLVQDTNGCLLGLTQIVTEPTAVDAVLSSMPSTCGSADGSALAVPSGGTPPYTYLWSNGDMTANPSALAGGMYSVVVTDSNGCQFTDSILVGSLGSPAVAITSSMNPSCFGGADGYAVATASLGTGPYTYQWNVPFPVNTDSISGLHAATWIVTVTDSTGCTATDSITLVEPSELLLVMDSIHPTCFGFDDGEASVVASGGTPTYSYIWNSVPAQMGDNATGLFAGGYAVIVTDANGCTATDSVILVDPPMVNAAFTSSPTLPGTLEIPNAFVSFSNLSQNASFYDWSFGDGGTSTLMDPSYTYNDAGEYCVELIAADSAGCADTLEVCSFSVVITEFIIPNTFTPNNDGRNDVFQIVGIEQYPNNHLQVFNRWGNLIYEKAQYQNDWEGNNYKTGDPLPDGAYFYIFKTGVEGVEDLMGDVVIFR